MMLKKKVTEKDLKKINGGSSVQRYISDGYKGNAVQCVLSLFKKC